MDQVLWSAAFFIFNAVLGLGAPAGYFANVAVGTSLGLIALAIARAWAVDSPLLLIPTIERTPRTASRTFLISGLSACGAYCFWAAVIVGSFRLEVAVLCFALVYGDNVRYVLLTKGRPDWTLAFSAVYLIVSGVSATVYLGVSGVSPAVVVATWSFCLVGFGFTSKFASPESKHNKSVLNSFFLPRLAIASEAAYVMAASQVGLLAVSALQNPDSVAGLRVAYAVALAPAALIIQGLGSQVVRATGRRQGNRAGVTLALSWGGIGSFLYASNASLVSVVGSSGLGGGSILEGIEPALPFVWPLTAFLASQFLFNSMHAAYRFHVRIRSAQTLRIGTLSLDIAVQVGALAIFGVPGVTYGYLVAALLRVVTWGVMTVWLVRRTHPGSSLPTV